MPELRVFAGGAEIASGGRTEVPGKGALRLEARGCEPGSELTFEVGDRAIPVEADADGTASWASPRLLGQVAGALRVAIPGCETTLVVRPGKLLVEAIGALVADLEDVGLGLAQDAGAVTTLELRSREHDLAALDGAVGLAASAAAAIRRRPIHRARESVRAVPSERGARSPADVSWLARHPVQAIRAGAGGRRTAVVRERRADLDTLENRGVLAAYDRLGSAVSELHAVVARDVDRLEAGRPAREAFLTDTANLWEERDLPRFEALARRQARLATLAHEVAATRKRSGLPDLRPRTARMVRTARVDAEPAYWATFRAFEVAERARVGATPPAPAPVRALDELWEQWTVVAVARAIAAHLGPPAAGVLVDPGWFATLRRGAVATWSSPRRTVELSYEPEIAHAPGPIRKLFPGRPWRPDVLVAVRWADGTVDLHVLDAKYRLEAGGPPTEALRELWWRYGEGIGDALGRPLVRSLWVVAPGDGLWLAGPTMLSSDWPVDRLRGGVISVAPRQREALDAVIAAVL